MAGRWGVWSAPSGVLVGGERINLTSPMTSRKDPSSEGAVQYNLFICYVLVYYLCMFITYVFTYLLSILFFILYLLIIYFSLILLFIIFPML